MKSTLKIVFAVLALAIANVGWSATSIPVQLLNPIGSTSGQAIVSTGATTAPAWSNINAATLGGATFASPPASGYGSATPEPVAATTVSATGAVTGFTGRLLNVQVITSTQTYTATTGTAKVIVETIGGGGGSGGNAATSNVQNAASGGGGSGSYAKVLLTSGFSGVTVTIGAAGTAGAAGANAGGTGGTTSFGTLISCPGGIGGAGGNAVAAASSGGTGGAGGAACSISSGTAIASIAGQNGYGGAIVLFNSFIYGGGGGSNPLGFGGAQNGASSPVQGSGKGSGAGGFISVESAAAAAGAAGQAAEIIVYEFSN